MKIVAVTQLVGHYPDRDETRDALDQRLITFLLLAGFAPVPIPNGLYKTLPDGRIDHQALETWVAAVEPHAFVLSGGVCEPPSEGTLRHLPWYADDGPLGGCRPVFRSGTCQNPAFAFR